MSLVSDPFGLGKVLPRAAGRVVVNVPVAAVPELVDHAVHTIPQLVVTELDDDTAAVVRRTTLAMRALRIELTFTDLGDGMTAVDALANWSSAFDPLSAPGATVRAILAAITAAASAR